MLGQLDESGRFLDRDAHLGASEAYHAAVIDLAENEHLSRAFRRLRLREMLTAVLKDTPATPHRIVPLHEYLTDSLAAGDAAVAHDPLTSYGITAALGWGLYAGVAAADFLGGRREVLLDYARLVDRAFAQYLILHHDRYLVERRWPDSVFWRRRQRRADA